MVTPADKNGSIGDNVRARHEGHVEVPGGRVWYARLGEGDAMPLLMLHGGPGAAHDYLLPLAERLSEHRPVYVYDQLGCGHSDRPNDRSLWTVARAVAELAAVRAALGLHSCHLLGHSWGGWLSIEYMTGGAAGISGLVLASTSASIPQFLSETDILIDQMPEPHRTALVQLGAQGLYEDPTYLAAVDAFLRRHLCRLDPWPDFLDPSWDTMEENQVYQTMAGPNDLVIIGTLRGWDRSKDLGSIRSPTLVTCGRHDEITPACSATIASGVPDSRMVVFENCGHLAHVEQPDHFAETVGAFLTEVDAS
jgi:proline-specific peptidase